MTWLTLWLLLSAPPEFIAGEGVAVEPELLTLAHDSWAELARLFVQATGSDAQSPTLVRLETLPPGARLGGASELGRIRLHPALLTRRDPNLGLVLKHELAHQLLLVSCPAATDDRLFHEAFAVAASGELGAWVDGPYLSTPQAARLLSQSQELDTPDRRRALSRLLSESEPDVGGLPKVLRRRLNACASHARWQQPLTVAELTAGNATETADAWLVLNRHSGEVLESRGAANLPMPFGSILKPFVAAAGVAAPSLATEPSRDVWACGDALPKTMGLKEALSRSCNGYFLDWNDPVARTFGSFGPLFLALGLSRLPHEMAEAIGAKPTLTLSPWAVAQAYRTLALSRPDVMTWLQRTAQVGTLKGLPSSAALMRFSVKTGTVRDASSKPRVGWLVAVTPDLVAVMTQHERVPREFADEFLVALQGFVERRSELAVTTQVFGLVPSAQVQAECRGIGVVATATLQLLEAQSQSLVSAVERGPLLCLGAPWLIQFPKSIALARQYAGSFSLLPLPPPTVQAPGTAKQQRARRGSELAFTTSLARYAVGVVRSEDASAKGEARTALLQVAAHNVFHSRHPERPVCDTTHCQVFLGTVAPEPRDTESLAKDWLVELGWLLFSQGGEEAWHASRSLGSVTALLGENPSNLHFDGERVYYQRTVKHGDSLVDEAASLSCELLRSPLRLPSCPTQATFTPEQVEFSGRGKGHGQGLDVEWAKRSGLDAKAILHTAYGALAKED